MKVNATVVLKEKQSKLASSVVSTLVSCGVGRREWCTSQSFGGLYRARCRNTLGGILALPKVLRLLGLLVLQTPPKLLWIALLCCWFGVQIVLPWK